MTDETGESERLTVVRFAKSAVRFSQMSDQWPEQILAGLQVEPAGTPWTPPCACWKKHVSR
jgi:hypothetical protein